MGKRKINEIIIHCSDSSFGDMPQIDHWHREFGWSCIGYHFVITNGIKVKRAGYDLAFDGLIQNGRKVKLNGAHCRGRNEHSIGICLIGTHSFTSKQFQALQVHLKDLMEKHSLTPADIHCHYEYSEKSCPNIDVELIRDLVR